MFSNWLAGCCLLIAFGATDEASVDALAAKLDED